MSRYAVTPIARELERAIQNGEMCSERGATFVRAHGATTACSYCWSRLSLAEQKIIQKATHDEANVDAFKQLARLNRKSRRNR